MTVEFGNAFYLMYILIAAGAVVGLYFLLRHKSEPTQKWVLFGILMFNFALHFAKLLFPPYINDLPNELHKATLENICAVSTVLFPFLFMLPKKWVTHDYFYFIGVISGLLALLYPTEALGEKAFAFDTIRFYICHTGLLVVPLVAALIGYRRPRLKYMWGIPLGFLVHETIVMVNELCLLKTGLIEGTLQTFFDRGARNNSFVHGPTPDMDGIGKFLTFFTPRFMQRDIFGINGGVDFYWPVLWLIVPVFVYFIPIYLAIASPVSKEVWVDLKEYKKKEK